MNAHSFDIDHSFKTVFVNLIKYKFILIKNKNNILIVFIFFFFIVKNMIIFKKKNTIILDYENPFFDINIIRGKIY